MIKLINNVYSILRPTSEGMALPIVFDSPHSGVVYPTSSNIIAPGKALKTTWDAYVDELWSSAPRAGASLLCARFPRAYIDVNRSLLDIDQELLSKPWPGPVTPSDACKRGMGLIRRFALPNVPMYAEPLSIEEVKQRIQQYYLPYHEVLKDLTDKAHASFGNLWHVNCHSMKSVGNAMNSDCGASRPDMVVSDCDGTSSDPMFTDWAATQLRKLGYQVSVNSPYHGGHIVRQYGVPAQRRNSIQIEINRSLYLNETTYEKSDGFETLQQNLEAFVDELSKYVRWTDKMRGWLQREKNVGCTYLQ
ncbi:N-formylglutamate amidohydrolase [Noviherbaspirillum sp.]|uniref:N-formylglutamate amidohydrolase n=1 Tax=Noviherbaspirillum sp. TaxID=1926288 RepID=UPI002FE1B218